MLAGAAVTIQGLMIRPKELLNEFYFTPSIPSGAKARVDFAAFAARLKPCPFKTLTYSEAPKNLLKFA
jgi:hypothetical protein